MMVLNLKSGMNNKVDYFDAGYDAFYKKNYEAAISNFTAALNIEKNIFQIHMIHNELIQSFYRLRNTYPDALENCILFCKKDIEILPEFARYYKKEWPPEKGSSLPECPSLKQLIIIYEKQKKFDEVIKICLFAIAHGYDDRYDWYNKTYGTKKGFKEKLIKLEKKRS